MDRAHVGEEVEVEVFASCMVFMALPSMWIRINVTLFHLYTTGSACVNSFPSGKSNEDLDKLAFIYCEAHLI